TGALGASLGRETFKDTILERPAEFLGAALFGQSPRLAGKEPVPTLGQQNRMHGVRLSEGQRTGDLDLLQTEQKARSNQLGPKAYQHVKAFDEAQASDVDRLHDRTARGMDPLGNKGPTGKTLRKNMLVDSPQEAGEMIGEQLGATARMRR